MRLWGGFLSQKGFGFDGLFVGEDIARDGASWRVEERDTAAFQSHLAGFLFEAFVFWLCELRLIILFLLRRFWVWK